MAERQTRPGLFDCFIIIIPVGGQMVGHKHRRVTDCPVSDRKKAIFTRNMPGGTCAGLEFDRKSRKGRWERRVNTERDDDRVQAKSNTIFAPEVAHASVYIRNWTSTDVKLAELLWYINSRRASSSIVLCRYRKLPYKASLDMYIRRDYLAMIIHESHVTRPSMVTILYCRYR